MVKLNGRDPLAYSERGYVYDLLDQYGKARADYEKAIELDPQNAQFHYELAWFLSHCLDVPYRDRHRAFVHATRAVELAPREASYRILMAEVYFALECRDEALTEVQKALELAPDSVRVAMIASWVYRGMGDLKSALSNAQKAVELEPESAGAHHALALVLVRLKEDEEALAAINRAIEVNAKPNATVMFYMYDRR